MAYNELQMGEYVSLRKTPNGDLEITATAKLREDADEFRDRLQDWGEESTLQDIFEDHLCATWSWIRPEEVGALTSGSILADDPERDEEGDLISVDRVYWDSMYQVQSTVEALLDDGKVVWKGSCCE